MKNTPASIAVCNQKGGIGKSTFTVLLASYLHYTAGRNVVVGDCDYPQWSVYAQRELSVVARRFHNGPIIYSEKKKIEIFCN